MASDLSGTTLGIPKQVSALLCAIDGELYRKPVWLHAKHITRKERLVYIKLDPFLLDDLYLLPPPPRVGNGGPCSSVQQLCC